MSEFINTMASTVKRCTVLLVRLGALTLLKSFPFHEVVEGTCCQHGTFPPLGTDDMDFGFWPLLIFSTDQFLFFAVKISA